MHSRIWESISAEQFLRLAQQAADARRADLFLAGVNARRSSDPYADSHSYIAIGPDDEMVAGPDTGHTDLEAFAYADSRPCLGFLSYQYGLLRAGLKPATESSFPLGHLKKYRTLIEYDVSSKTLSANSREPGTFEWIEHVCYSMTEDAGAASPSVQFGPAVASWSGKQYRTGVARTLDYIREGHVYQLCLSTQYTADFEGELSAQFLLALLQEFPAPFYVWYRSGHYQLVSTSPECFLDVTNGHVASRPIKGTMPFRDDPDRLAEQLRRLPKEDAELSMIVDLLRNDIAKNCEYGSVKVKDHKSVFAVDNLLQMYSIVEGSLRSDRTCLDLLLDAFPGGSVTGCPKSRALRLIEELEPHSRDIYCGSFFIIRGRRDMKSSIAIRSGYFDLVQKYFRFFAGSGIVIDSKPESEYLETRAKAAKFLALCKTDDNQE